MFFVLVIRKKNLFHYQIFFYLFQVKICLKGVKSVKKQATFNMMCLILSIMRFVLKINDILTRNKTNILGKILEFLQCNAALASKQGRLNKK